MSENSSTQRKTNQQVLLVSRPEGMPKLSDFEVVEAGIPSPGDGEMLILCKPAT